MIDPTTEHLQHLRRNAGRDRLLLTLAPERSGSLAAIRKATDLRIKVSLGHTNASHQQILEAIQSGAVAFTHLGNGCPQALDRHDNILWRLFETPDLQVTLIPDAVHLSPSLFRLIHREVDPRRICYVSDAMSAADMPPGRYGLGQLKLQVGSDRVVRLPGTPNFAGSSLRPVDGVFHAAHMLGCSWRATWPRFSEQPAALLGLESGLTPGKPADLCILSRPGRSGPKSMKVISNGQGLG